MTDEQSLHWLTMQEIAERLAVGYGEVRGYCDVEEVRDWLGAVKAVGAKGFRYPESAVELLRYLLERDERGERRADPSNAARFIETFSSEPGNVLLPQSSRSTALTAPVKEPDVAALLAASVELLQQHHAVLHALTGGRPLEDEFLTAQEACAMLRCGTTTLRRRVRPVAKGRWRRSDILRYIAGAAPL